MKMVVALDRLPVGVPGTVIDMGCQPAFYCKFQKIGILPGTCITVRYRSPGRGVSVVEFCDRVLALPSRELRGIYVRWENKKGY